jgi:FixJ family two-component response regulator
MPPAEPTSAGAPHLHLNIAVIDDDEGLRRALDRLLKASGFRVSSYASAEQFLEYAVPDRVHCLILDIHLDGMSGFDLQRYFAASGRTLPIVLMSAHDEPGTVQQAQLAGCAFLIKPFSRESLLEAIEKALGQAGPA